VWHSQDHLREQPFLRNILPTNPQSGGRAIRLPPDPLDISAGVSGAQTPGTEYTGFSEYLAMAKRRWLLIVAVMAIATAYTVNSVRTERPQYKSRATVRLINASRAIAGDMADRSAGSPDMPFSVGADPIASQLQVLQSEAVVSTAVDLKGLRLVPAEKSRFVPEITDAAVSDESPASLVKVSFTPAGFSVTSGGRTVSSQYGSPAEVDGVRLTVSKQPNVAGTTFDVVSRESAINSILGNFQASGRPRTDIIDLSYTALDPNQATRVANAMAEAYQLYSATSAKQFSLRRRTFLEAQLRQADSSLNAANTVYAAFHNGRQNAVASSTAQSADFAKVQGQKSDLESQKRLLESILAKTRQPGQTASANARTIIASPSLAANPLIQQLTGQLSTQEGVREDLLAGGAAPTNPDLITVNSQIATTNSRLIDAVESLLQSVDTQLQSLGNSGSSGSPALAAGGGDVREAQLAADVQAAQKLQGDIKEELQKARMSEAVEAGQVEIVQLSRGPGSQISTGATRRILLGLIVGLMFGVGVAVFAESLDKSIRRRGDIEPMLGIPGLVVVPRLERSAGSQSRTLPPMSGRVARSDEATDMSDRDLVTVSNPRSPSAESFRTLRTNLMFSQAVNAMRTLVVTSASPGEGKTVTASNLAVAFAQQGLRVLLVDCDLRKGRLHRVFNAVREPGMSDFVLGFASEEEVTRTTSVSGLYLMPTGKLPPNPSELLGGEQAKAKLAALTEGYDLVIIDTPPLLAASDAAILATLSDGVIMVLRAGATEAAAAQQSIQQMQVLGARVVGAVLNDPDAQVPRYGAYYEYQYSAADA
jgi:capsular exopolysaccharide synthesis family protein